MNDNINTSGGEVASAPFLLGARMSPGKVTANGRDPEDVRIIPYNLSPALFRATPLRHGEGFVNKYSPLLTVGVSEAAASTTA
jgi:hypothetical protein